MTASEVKVVLFDMNLDRRRFLVDLLERAYGFSPRIVNSWDELRRLLRGVEVERISLVVLGDPGPEYIHDAGLPKMTQQILLGMYTQVDFVLVLLEHSLPSFDCVIGMENATGRAIPLVVPDMTGGENEILAAFRSVLKAPPERLPVPTFYPGPEPDPVLYQQISSLHKESYSRASVNLQMILRAFWKCERATVHPIGQGFSGDLVLRINPDPGLKSPNYVLKIFPQVRFRRLENELLHWEDIRNTLDRPQLRPRVPHLHPPRAEYKNHSLRCIEAGGHYAVAYQFLGEPIGEFVSLEKAYKRPASISSAANPTDALTRKQRHAFDPLAERIIEDVLKCLSEAWYAADKSDLCTVPLWSTSVGSRSPSDGIARFPPYYLSSGQKADILLALEYLESYGTKLLFGKRAMGQAAPEITWDSSGRVVRAWVQGNSVINSKTWPIRLTPVHGDLNKSNILIWETEPRPFFIDFTTYVNRGHALQDLAQLEAEVKFQLMDTEESSLLPAFDHTHTQLEFWCEAESKFILPGLDMPPFHRRKKTDGILRAYQIAGRIRRRALEIHNCSGVPLNERCPFSLEYAASLLYHTLLVIGYREISPFKRLFAVYSAAQLIAVLTDRSAKDVKLL